MTVNKKYVLYSTLLTLLPGALAAENSTTVFREEFDSYGNDYQGFNTGSSIWEYPPSLKIFTFSPEKYSKMTIRNLLINPPLSSA